MNLNSNCTVSITKEQTRLESIIDSLIINNGSVNSFISSISDQILPRMDVIANKLNYTSYYKNTPQEDGHIKSGTGKDCISPYPEGKIGDLQQIGDQGQELTYRLNIEVYNKLLLFVEFLESQI